MKAAPTKRCPSCNTHKPLTSYRKRKSSKDGLQAYCKSCQVSDNSRRLHSAANGSLEGFLAYLITHAKKRSRRFDLPFDLTTDHLLALWRQQGGRCALTGRHMHTKTTRRHARPDTCTIDRIDPSLGYVEGNVRLLTSWANVAKHSLSDDELTHWATALANTLSGTTTPQPGP